MTVDLETGEYGAWRWVVSKEMALDLDRAAARYFVGKRLCVTAFDSGCLQLTPDELSAGWSYVGEVACSPRLKPETDVPCGGFDEWYVFDDVPMSWSVEERFVNLCGFTLSKPFESSAGKEHNGRDAWLPAIQGRFWRNLDVVRPIAYIASGFLDIVASTDAAFVDELTRAARGGSELFDSGR